MTDFITIAGPRVLLRDPLPEDFDAQCRWTTVETDWQDWDAPWEGKTISPPRSPEEQEAARQRFLNGLLEPRPMPRNQLWVQLISGPLLGWASAYHHDPAARAISIGVNVCESSYWGRGLGSEALRLWLGYLFTHCELDRIGLGTWSGNARMVRVAEKCGFVLSHRNVGRREVRGQTYDGLDFALPHDLWDGWIGEER